MTAPNRNIHIGQAVVEELVRWGVSRFVVSPGSRSTPLALAVAERAGARAIVHFDERGAGFLALGWAKSAGRPVCLICTSGTAAANYYPAVVEAAQALVPLIVLTADRPPELLDTGANQAILQEGMFGRYVRWQASLPADDAVPLEAILTCVDQAVHRAMRAPAGPVHVNCSFREPLAPEPAPYAVDETPRVSRWRDSGAPYTRYAGAEPAVADTEALGELREVLANAERGVVIAGALPPGDAAAVAAFCGELGWPLFADVQSGLRLQAAEPSVVRHYDQLLLHDGWLQAFRPDAILQFGSSMVSKRLASAIARAASPVYAMVAGHPLRQDPGHLLTHRVEMTPAVFCAALRGTAGCSTAWRDAWRRGSEALEPVLDSMLLGADEALSEPALARLLPRLVPRGGILFLGNSMPIRDADMYGGMGEQDSQVAANRGASGIDGNIATAAGFAMEGAVTTAVIGDLALLHDVNALHLLHKAAGNVIVVCVNNDGGGIFSFLPIARYTEHFEPFWAAPHGMHFAEIAAAFGLRYARPGTARAFEEAYRDALAANVPALLEVTTERAANHALHADIQRRVIAALDAVPRPRVF